MEQNDLGIKINLPNAKDMELKRSAESIGVTVEMLLEMRAYAKKLALKYPKWKPEKIQNRVAEHFKTKLT